MHFTKMQGAGNDFVILNNLIEHIPLKDLSRLAHRLCSRRLSIGADGLMVVDRASSPDADYSMRFFNADGSPGEMCGNGARCIARYGYEQGLAGSVQRIETTAGLVIGRRIDARRYQIRLNDPSVLEESRSLPDSCAYVELGNPGIPHTFVLMDNWDQIDREELRRIGIALRYSSAFPKGVNVTFARLIGPDHLKAITYERGVEDFTLACGTGCGSMTAVLTLQGIVSGKDVRIDMPGGQLSITLDVAEAFSGSAAAHDAAARPAMQASGVSGTVISVPAPSIGGRTVRNILLTGPTNLVCEGTVMDEDL